MSDEGEFHDYEITDLRVLHGRSEFDSAGRRIDYREECIRLPDGTFQKVGMAEVVRHPPQPLYCSRIGDPNDWDFDVEPDTEIE